MYCLKYPIQKENAIIEQILQCTRSKTPNFIESTKIAFSWTEKVIKVIQRSSCWLDLVKENKR